MDEPWPYNAVWLEREEPLARCPYPRCRRAGLCGRMAVPWRRRLPCRRTHEHQDELYDRLSRKLDAFAAEARRARKPGEPDPWVEPGSEEFERRYAILYNMVREGALAEESAQKAKKPARGLAHAKRR